MKSLATADTATLLLMASMGIYGSEHPRAFKETTKHYTWEEYDLILKKKSNLPASTRKGIVRHFERLKSLEGKEGC